MSINSVNQSTYTSEEGVSSYITNTLQSPEVTILVKYKDYYYNRNVLDIGCGAGRTSFYFRNFTQKYIGVDYSKSMIDYCEHQYSELTFKHADARDLSQFTDNCFDFIIFSYNGIDYISNEDRILVLKEVHRILKNDGVFVFSTHNRNFKNIEITPQFEFSLNPINFTKNLLDFFKQKQKNSKLKKEEVNNNDYAILNDSGNGFSLLTYYITREKQLEQLKNTGFKLLEMFKMSGETLELTENDSNEPWIYFVLNKQT